jgi:hypothetical protein
VALSLTTTICAQDVRHIDTAIRTTKARRRADQGTHTMIHHLPETAIVPLETKVMVVTCETRAAAATREIASADTGLADTTTQKRNRMFRP